MLNLSLASRIALARAAANPGMPVPSVASATTSTTTTTDAAPTTTDASSDEVDRFFDAPEDFSSVEVGRSNPPLPNNNDGGAEDEEEAYFNASEDEFVAPSWWNEEEGGEGVDNGDDGYFWSDDDGVDPQASLFAEQDLCAPAATVEIDENARPIAPLRRRLARVTKSGNDAPVPAPAQKAHLAPDDLLASGCYDVAPERTDSSVVSEVAPHIEVEYPVVSADITVPIVVAVGVTPATVTADPVTADPISADPVIEEDELMPLAGPIPAPAIIVPAGTATTDICLDYMDIDGPDFSVLDDPMEVDWFAPCLAHEFARILGLGGRRSGVSSGRSMPSFLANSRSSARLGVRSARFGARVAGKRVPSVRVAASRRLRLASGRK